MHPERNAQYSQTLIATQNQLGNISALQALAQLPSYAMGLLTLTLQTSSSEFEQKQHSEIT